MEVVKARYSASTASSQRGTKLDRCVCEQSRCAGSDRCAGRGRVCRQRGLVCGTGAPHLRRLEGFQIHGSDFNFLHPGSDFGLLGVVLDFWERFQMQSLDTA